MSRGWRSAVLGDVCEMIKRGVAPKYVDSGGVCVINQKCIRNHGINLRLSRRHDISAKKIQSERYIQPGDVLVNSTGTGTLGRVAQVRAEAKEPTTVDTHVTIVRPIEGMFHPEFFGYMLVQIEDEIASSGEGTSGQTELSRKKLEQSFTVSFPESLEEQKRIVAILDEAFAGIERAVANTEKNLSNARELFESYLNSEFAVKISSGRAVSLAKLCQPRTITYGVIKLGNHINDGVPCLRTSNVRRLKIETEKMKRIGPELSQKYHRTVLRGGEVLVNVRGTLGGVAVVEEKMKGWNVSREIAVAPVEQNKILPSFAAYFIATKASQEWLTGVQKGVAYRGINLADLRKLPIFLPSLENQARIVGKLDEMMNFCSELEQIAQRKLAALSELKQSLLQKAFSGELSADPERALKEAAA
jgi:type I restriction enzyme S subunit